MTRREMREHCFKMLFGVGFYPPEEASRQAEQYFASPEEDDTREDGTVEIIHQVDMKEADQAFLRARVEDMTTKVPKLDEQLNEVAQGWKTRRIGKGGAHHSPSGLI